MSNLYDILGVSKTATKEEINKAYKKLAVKWHPDKNLDNKDEAEEKFKNISSAYEILSDVEEKNFYDRHGKTKKEMSESQPNMGDVFGMFNNMNGFPGFSGFPGFGGFNRNVINVQPDIVKQISIELIDIYNGKMINLTYQKMIIDVMTNSRTVEKLDYELNLEIGFDPRQKKVIYNKGNTINMPNNKVIGNLIIEFQIIRPKNYNIKGVTLDLFNMQKISLVQALCGLEMSIKLPNDKKIKIYYDEVIQPNKYYKIKNVGIPYRDLNTNELLNHDLYINFEIIYPHTLDNKIKKSLCELFGYTFNPTIDNSIILEPSNIESDEMENNNNEENFQGVQCAQQ